MPIEPTTFVLLMLLGGIVAVDGTSVGQFMVSRPIVAATVAGFFVGEPGAGVAIGVILEAFQLTVLPVGAAKYPEGGPAAVSGAAVYASSGMTSNMLLLTVVGVLLLEWLGGESVATLRRANVSLMRNRHGPLLNATVLERRHLAAIGLDYLRGMLLVAAGIPLLWLTVRAAAPLWALDESVSRMLLSAAVAGLLAATVRMVGRRAWYAAAGAIGGAGLLLLV